MTSSQTAVVVVGVLYKYVNALQGWRPRLVVVDPVAGHLFYYHIAGTAAVRVGWVEEELQHRYGGRCEVEYVGVQVGLLRRKEDEGAMAVSWAEGGTGQLGRGGEVFNLSSFMNNVRVKVVELKSVRESNQDDRKIWVNERLELKAESQDDRWVWTNALRRAMEMKIGGPSRECWGLGHVRCVEEHLETKPGGEGNISGEVEAAMERMHATSEMKKLVASLVEKLEKEYKKRRLLLDIVYRLENDKRELETRLAVEGVCGTGGQEGGIGDDGTIDDSLSTAADEDGSDGEIDEEVFFDAEEGGKWLDMERSSSLGELASFDAYFGLNERIEVRSSSGDLTALTNRARPAGAESSVPLPPTSGHRRRARLPHPQQEEKAISLWSLIKEMVGKDLTRVCLPVYFNEPLSALELTAEDLEYSELLDIAASHPPGSMERIINIMAFAVSPYSSTEGRTSKPFNPLLGETYELCSQDKGFRFIAEKVSHHPTIIAAHAVGGWKDGGAASRNNKWTYQGDAEIKSKFWGRSIELRPEGVLTLDFEDGDSYSWNKVTTSINNLIIGKIYVDHGGLMKIRRHAPGSALTIAKVRFKETKMLFDRDPRRVEGHIEIDGVRKEYPYLEGHWNESIDVNWGDGRRERVWTKNPMPEPENRNRYNLTRYAIGLNEITPEMEGKLAPTDSRLRPDQRLTELGMWDEANAEKLRLEHKQRAARKAAEEGVPLKPRWFKINQEKVHLNTRARGHHISSKELSFAFTGEYWDARAQGEFEDVRDIFG